MAYCKREAEHDIGGDELASKKKRERAGYMRQRRADMAAKSPDKLENERAQHAQEQRTRRRSVDQIRTKDTERKQQKRKQLRDAVRQHDTAYDFTDSFPEPYNTGKMDCVCSSCSALHFEGERKIGSKITTFLECCCHGKVKKKN